MQPKCNLILDSCCDLHAHLIPSEGVDLIQFPYLVDDEEHFDDLFATSSPKDFYDLMRAGSFPSTAQIPMGVISAAFEKAALSGVPTVFLCFSSALSGTYETACLLLEQTKEAHPEAELYIVDTRLASVAEGLYVYEALAQREKGLSAKELVEWCEEALKHLHAYFMVDSLDALARGGRIPKSVANVGTKLDVKALLTIDMDGKLGVAGMARGRKKGIKQLVEFYDKYADKNADSCVFVGNADCPKDAQRLTEIFQKAHPDTPVTQVNIGPVIGCHVGPDMLAIVFWGEDRTEQLSVADRIARKVKGE